MEFKFTVEEVDTSSAFARSVPMARPNGMVVEVNDVFVPRSQAARDLSTQLCNLTHSTLVTESASIIHPLAPQEWSVIFSTVSVNHQGTFLQSSDSDYSRKRLTSDVWPSTILHLDRTIFQDEIWC